MKQAFGMIDLGVAVLPGKTTSEIIIKLNKELRKRHKTSYALGKGFHPHITLYQGTFEKYKDLENAMEKIVLPEEKIGTRLKGIGVALPNK